jgi:hypothetical protein
MFGSLFEIVKDTTRIVTAPVEMVVDIVSIPVKEVASVAQDLVEEVKSLKD